MAGALSSDNALRWAHFRLRGGWKNLLSTGIGLAVILGGLIALSVRADPRNATNNLAMWTMGLLGLQCAILLLWGSNAIVRAVRRDIASGMLESHRLMPVSGLEGVVGYLTGPPAQAAAMSVIVLAIGFGTAGAAGVAPGDWLLANFILACFAGLAWIAIVLLSLVTPSAMTVIVMLAVLMTMSSLTPMSLVPGLALLCGPVIDHTVFGIIDRGGTWSLAHQVSLMSQFAAAIFLFAAAARRYRRDDVLPFTPLMALAALATWVAMATWGLLNVYELVPMVRHSGLGRGAQVIASTLVTMLVAVVPVTSAVWLREQWAMRRRLGDAYAGHRPAPVNLVAVAAAAIVFLMPLIVDNADADAWPRRLVVTAGVIVVFLVSVGYLVRMMFGRVTRWMLLGLFVFITWLIPLVLDFTRAGMVGVRRDEDLFSEICGASPIGALILAWSDWRGLASPVPGLVVQVILMVALGAVCHLTARRGNRAAAS